jgi:proliferating cell nuclear antigen
MEIQIEGAEHVRKIFDAAKEIVKEVNLCVNDDGLTFTAMDNSHVCILKVAFHKTGCLIFNVQGHHVLGLNMEVFCKFLATCEQKDDLVFRYDESKDYLNLEFLDKLSTEYANYSIKLMQIDDNEYTIPEIQFDVVILLPFIKLYKIIKDLLSLGDTVQIKVDKTGAEFSLANSDSGSGGRTLRESESVKIERNVETIILVFSLNYFYRFVKTNITQESVRLGLKDKMPMMLEVPVDKLATLKYYMAPKLDDF